MRIIVIFPALLVATLLAGCMSVEEREAQRNAQDDAKCLTYGAQQGSQAYVQCRTQLDTTRTMANAMRRSRATAPQAYTPPAAPVTCLRTGAMVTCN